MRLARGRDLREVFELARERPDGWTETRALQGILKVCEAMAYAHSKGVIHRDLKPGNVMVGRFGEVYVMDSGLAKLIGREDRKAPRLRVLPETTETVDTERARERELDPEKPLLTMDGTVVGTPAYIRPSRRRDRSTASTSARTSTRSGRGRSGSSRKKSVRSRIGWNSSSPTRSTASRGAGPCASGGAAGGAAGEGLLASQVRLHAVADGEPWEYHLPGEEQWAGASRGADGRFVPWGDGFDRSFCNDVGLRLGGVGIFLADESPFGVRDKGSVATAKVVTHVRAIAFRAVSHLLLSVG